MHKFKNALIIGGLAGIATIPGALLVTFVWPVIQDVLVSHDDTLQRLVLNLVTLIIATGVIVVGFTLLWRNRARLNAIATTGMSFQLVSFLLAVYALMIFGSVWIATLFHDTWLTVEILRITGQWP